MGQCESSSVRPYEGRLPLSVLTGTSTIGSHALLSPQDPEFQPDLVTSKSLAAAGLCSWVINIVRFYEVFCEVEPKRQALSKANSELATAQEKLGAIKAKINVSVHLVSQRQTIPAVRLTVLFASYLLQACCMRGSDWLTVNTNSAQHY